MSKKNTNQDINANFNEKYTADRDYYPFYIYRKKKWNKWWLLLLLLPALTLIQCNRTIDAVCIDPETNSPIEGVKVEMEYNAYLTKDSKGLGWVRHISRSKTTDEAGVARFEKLPCSVFSYLFCCLSEASFTAKSECYATTDQKCNFHYTKVVKLDMEPRCENLYIKVLDNETGDILPDASVVYSYVNGTGLYVDSTETDAAGIAMLEGIRFCSVITRISASSYGYADTAKAAVPAPFLLIPVDSMALRLRPIKESFTFFVKDKETHEPIANALARVTLTHPNGSHISSELHTSIDGKGRAVYEDAFILSTIAIHASKLHYKDGDLEGGPWTVDKFKLQADDVRTVWLEAEPYVMNFTNIDSINGAPVPNVKNRIRVTDPAGNVEEYEETSNRNGVFPVKAKEGSVIEIISEGAAGYKDKATNIPDFEGAEKVKLQPKMVTVSFRTIDFYESKVLPDCRLAISGSISGQLPPSTSGNGEFEVEARYLDNLSIAASKMGYLANSTKIKDTPVSRLEVAPQNERDIPLLLDLPPCEGGTNVPKGSNENYHKRSYAMGKMTGTTYIDCDFYSMPDFLTVYDGTNTSATPIVSKRRIADKASVPVNFTKGAVTVVIESSQGNSSWEYVVRCPD